MFQDPDRPRTTIPGKVILVVDDDPAVIEGMQRILNGMGYVTDSALDGLAQPSKKIDSDPEVSPQI